MSKIRTDELQLPDSLEELIKYKHEYFSTFKAFESFLDNLHAAENLQFLIAINDYVENPNATKFMSIHNNFVETKSKFWICLSAQNYNDLRDCKQQHITQSRNRFIKQTEVSKLLCLTLEKLNLAYQEISAVLQADLWPKFVKFHQLAVETNTKEQ